MTTQQQQAAYEAKVREIAEEMARDDYGERWSYLFNTEDRHSIIKKYINPARIAVKHMAEQYKRGCLSWVNEDVPVYAYEPQIEDELRERGLVPPDDSNG